MIMKQFGQKLRRERRLAEITLERLAHDSGVSLTYIKSLEKGTQQPTLPAVFSLAHALKIDPCELITPAWQQWQKECQDKQK